MGSLLSVLKGGSSTGSSSSSRAKGSLLSGQTSLADQFPSAVLALEGQVTYDDSNTLLKDMDSFVKRGRVLLDRLNKYKGSSETIRKAITTPTPENEELAWNSLAPMISLLKDCYILSSDIESQIPNILDILLDSKEESQSHNVAAILFAQIMDYTFQFDTLKMGLSDIQNDLSFYRRIIHRVKTNQNNDENQGISSEITNQMSLFYAYHNPMIKTIIDKILSIIDASSKPKFLKKLVVLSSGAVNTVNSGNASDENKLLYVRVIMTTSIIYDWVSETGVFVSKSQIPILEIVSFIRNHIPANADAYLVSIQLGCKHFNDKETPVPVRKAFGLE